MYRSWDVYDWNTRRTLDYFDRTHSQEQQGAEHGQADGREHAGEQAQRAAAGGVADVAELDVAVFGQRGVRGAGRRGAEHAREVVQHLTAAVHQRYLLADVASVRHARRTIGGHLGRTAVWRQQETPRRLLDHLTGRTAGSEGARPTCGARTTTTTKKKLKLFIFFPRTNYVI